MIGRACSTYRAKLNAYRILVGNPENKKNKKKKKQSYVAENNIKINIRELRWGGMDWINVAQHLILLDLIILIMFGEEYKL
jgi:hypothetical protein